MNTGICTKCGKEGKVVMHHTNGYFGEHKDNVYPYCMSCHVKIHKDYRKSGRCKLSVEQITQLSRKSTIRRIFKERCKRIVFNESLIPNVELIESINIWPNRIYFMSCFHAHNGKKLYTIEIA